MHISWQANLRGSLLSEAGMDAEQKDVFLKEEYFALQQQYENYDSRALIIKGWVSAGSIAAIAIGLDPEKSNGGIIWWVIIIFSLCFWYLETMWKMFQYAISDRIRLIEAHFRGDTEILVEEVEPLQIYDWWFRSFQRDTPLFPYEQRFRPSPFWKRFVGAGSQNFVMLPYALIVAMCLVFLAIG